MSNSEDWWTTELKNGFHFYCVTYWIFRMHSDITLREKANWKMHEQLERAKAWISTTTLAAFGLPTWGWSNKIGSLGAKTVCYKQSFLRKGCVLCFWLFLKLPRYLSAASKLSVRYTVSQCGLLRFPRPPGTQRMLPPNFKFFSAKIKKRGRGVPKTRNSLFLGRSGRRTRPNLDILPD